MLKFKSPEESEAWLRRARPQAATLTAARMALRVLPVLAHHVLLDPSNMMNEGGRILPLSVFRAVATSWYAGTWADLGPEVADAAADAVPLSSSKEDWVGALAARNTALAARAAARAANGKDARGSAVDTLTAAMRAARFAVCHDSTMLALNADSVLARTETMGSHSEFEVPKLPERPLWPDGRMPELMGQLWHDLKMQMMTQEYNEGSEVWIDWYEARLSGAPADMEVEKARITILHKQQGESPANINAAIKELPPVNLKPAPVRRGRDPRNQKPLRSGSGILRP